jgi:hypothetical protein
MIILTIFTSSLLSALTIIFVYKISKYLTKNKKHRMIITIAAGLGTPIFPLAVLYQDYSVSLFFSFISFYLLFKAKREKISNNKHFLLSGMLSGFSISISLLAFVLIIAYILYVFLIKKKNLKYFLIGGFLGILPFLLYNYFIFGSPFSLPRDHLDRMLWSKMGGIHGLQIPNPFIALRLLFFPERGLLFYYPVFFFFFLGLFHMYKEFKIETVLISFIFISFLIVNSSWWMWWGGASFGPRHFALVAPFLTLPLIYVLKYGEINKYLKFCIYTLLIISILTNFMSFQIVIDEISEPSKTAINPEYENKVNTFQVISDPLGTYYLPLFLKYGPRSMILENLIDGHLDIDIRDFPLTREWEYPYFAKNHIPFLPFFILVLLLSPLWKNEIFSTIKKF